MVAVVCCRDFISVPSHTVRSISTHTACTLDWNPKDVNRGDRPLWPLWIWDVSTEMGWVMLMQACWLWPVLSDHCLPSPAPPLARLILCLLRLILTQGWEKNESRMLVRIYSSQHLSITSSPVFSLWYHPKEIMQSILVYSHNIRFLLSLQYIL